MLLIQELADGKDKHTPLSSEDMRKRVQVKLQRPMVRFCGCLEEWETNPLFTTVGRILAGPSPRRGQLLPDADALSTRVFLQKFKPEETPECPTCIRQEEDADHLFFKC